MADYRLDCCGGFPSHREYCRASPGYEQYQKRQAVIAKRKEQGYTMLDDGLWSCQHCGNVVWNPDLHSKFFAAHPDTQHPADKIKEQILNG